MASISVDALAVIRIAKHSERSSGFLVGIDDHVTGAYPFPSSSDSHSDAKNHAAYQDAMLKHLKEVNVDAQCIGWWTVVSMGNFIDQNFIDNQLHYQKTADDNKIALVFDAARSLNGPLNLKAYSLSSAFLNAHKEGKFTVESLQKSGFRYQDILVEHPVTMHNSHLVTTYLHQSSPMSLTMDSNRQSPQSLLDSAAIDHKRLDAGNLEVDDGLSLNIDSLLSGSCDLLLESIDAHQVETNNFQYHSRSMAREQSKTAAWIAKRKSENAIRAMNNQPPLDENEWQRLFKLPQEPSRLESLLVARQIEQYARQVDGFAATITPKMFAIREVL